MCVAHYVIALKRPYGSINDVRSLVLISLPPQSSVAAIECLFGFILDFAFRYVRGCKNFIDFPFTCRTLFRER